jgi:hypothetical protein
VNEWTAANADGSLYPATADARAAEADSGACCTERRKPGGKPELETVQATIAIARSFNVLTISSAITTSNTLRNTSWPAVFAAETPALHVSVCGSPVLCLNLGVCLQKCAIDMAIFGHALGRIIRLEQAE